MIYINGKAILHIVDASTRISAATFLDSHEEKYEQTTKGIWLAFIEWWCAIYTGY